MNTILACIFSVVLLFLSGLVFLLFNNTARKLSNLICLGASPILSIVVITTTFGLYSLGASLDTEYLGGYGVRAEYYEDWDEEVPCSHPIYCTRPTKCSDGKSGCTESYQCGWRHSYDVDYHPPYWEILDSNGYKFTIDSRRFNEIAERWKNRTFVDLHRNYHSNDGDKYVTVYDNEPLNLEPTSIASTYENKIPVSNSIFRLTPPSEQEVRELELYPYPPIYGYHQGCVLGPAAIGLKNDDFWLRYLNAKLGRSKQVRVFLLTFLNKPEDVSYAQEAYWEGGNKNELNICVGIDNNKIVQWARVFSYTERTDLTTDIKYYLIGEGDKKLNIAEFSKWLYPEIEQKWVRKQFTEVNKNLVVLYPFWFGAIAIIIGTLAGFTLAFAPYIGYKFS